MILPENNLPQYIENLNSFFIIKIDMEGRYYYVNETFCRRYQVQREHVIGKYSMDDVHPDDHAPLLATVEKCISNMGIGHEVVVRKPTPEQTFAHTRWELVALPGKDGRPACILGMGLEITNFVDDLSHTNTRIKQMKFTQSHILRKPVANILGILNVLDRGHMPEESQHLLDQLHQSAIELDEIIKELAKI